MINSMLTPVSYTHLDVYKRQAVNTIVFTPKSFILLKYLVFYQISTLGSGLCDVSTSVKNNWKVNNYNNFLIKRPIVTGVMSLNYRHFPL